MYLERIILDGFKSYASRTEVKDFDSSFNAITGLNGSGKSNILDSICFVLGITNLSQVRASSLQDLVYKSGQAGITKASVTLVFNNADKSTSPVGYEKPDQLTVCRQIVIGGRNKYLINGINAQPSRVQNLFHSVGLNVNNPHFLIMQGRITKVINMKPAEVLGMIEEAAGTKMYENKKEAALRTIEKKERKVEEINSLLVDKINPSIEKLERERKHYLEWNTNNNDIETLRRYVTAHKYWRAEQWLVRSSGQGSELHKKLNDAQESIDDLETAHKEASERLKQLLKNHEKDRHDGSLESKQDKVDELSKKVVQARSSWSNQKTALDSEQRNVKSVQENLFSLQQKRDSLCEEMAAAEKEIPLAEKKVEVAKEELESAETAMLTGASTQGSQGSSAGSIIDQLEAARRATSNAQAEIESLQLEKRHVSEEMEVKADQLSKDRANVRSLESKKKNAEKAISDAKLAVHELDFDSREAETLQHQLHQEKSQVAALEEKVDQFRARLGACEFRYSDPYPNFDRRKVHGLVATLIRVKDPKLTTAIEVTAGGRLYQVVVDTDSTANDLLKKGRLLRRVTILPLNKIKHEVLPATKVHRAKQIERSAELALSLVGYDHEVVNAIEHVFGRTLICPDMDSARRVTFDRAVRTRTVTLEGDSYDPSGTASGGSSTHSRSSVLDLLSSLSQAESELETHRGNVARLQNRVDTVNERARRYRQLQTTVQVREDEAKLLEKQLEETSTGRLMKEVELLRNRVTEIPTALKKAKECLRENSTKVQELEHAMEDRESAKEREKKEAEAALASIRGTYEESIVVLQSTKDKHSRLLVEIEATEEEIERLEKHFTGNLQPALEKLRREVQVLESKAVDISSILEDAKEELQKEKDRLARSNKSLGIARKNSEELAEKIETLNLEVARLMSQVKESERGRTSAEKLVAELDAKHAWITQEKDRFGVEGSEYEFSESKLASSSKELEELQNRQESLSKKINAKAMHMFETAKEEYRGLLNKKRIIEEDKEKIEKVISGLDEKKMVAVEKTWKKVNEDFGNIFSDLLPGTSAKLEPPEGKSVESGLEIRVAFGGVWKDSLSELSGGQRSLIALSLILAMLRFKPAPMYILDEVDAALDLSHTQNIGRMLRRHFTGSQFIVVSLKEGMFSNANVIFRTKFVNGLSTVKRTENTAVRENMTSPKVPSRIAPSSTYDKENIENQSKENTRRRKRSVRD
ncbi:Structural maintenance of chromosomes protein [Gracilaria domingensis]|nr:Structural maintenance of chromosomes protein [Gracilaria domingensis]